MQLPETLYADSHGLSIAYQVMGEGELDIVIAPGLISHVELAHDFPGYTRYLKRLCEFGRVITFDKRGQGLSDALYGTPTLEERMDDLLAVMNAAGSKSATIFGFSEGGALAFLTAATHPDKVTHIITFGAYAKACASETYPHMLSEKIRRERLTSWLDDWGRGGGRALSILAPELADDEMMRKLFARIERYSSTPSAMRRYFEVNFRIDVLDVLPAVRTPVLLLHREDDNQVPVSASRHLEEALENANYHDCGSGGHYYWVGEIEPSLTRIREFLTGDHSKSTVSNRALATILFTDIVGSTELVEKLGDDVWRDLLDRHDRIAGELVSLYRGRIIKHTGDGILAIFDGPGRAVECARQLTTKLDDIGIGIRSGLHTGEVELRDEDIGGVHVHLAARIMAKAARGEILVSRTVADLMIGNLDIEFQSRGSQKMKGFSKNIEILSVTN
ncbi:MAG: adenylate/guanylate cyclase domain-containing protein [Sneathiella sp.]|nr:adenylate/guanylate cyclase domain-containing protein [Sneathiella sp.]